MEYITTILLLLILIVEAVLMISGWDESPQKKIYY